jgi:hypothetical protein
VPITDFTRSSIEALCVVARHSSLFVMSALGMVILTTVVEVSHLIFVTNSQGMNR